MEVDRITRIGGLGQGETAWPATRVRRRKFVEEVEAAENEDEDRENEKQKDESAEAEDERPGRLDVTA